jgi:hypothetical protein
MTNTADSNFSFEKLNAIHNKKYKPELEERTGSPRTYQER